MWGACKGSNVLVSKTLAGHSGQILVQMWATLLVIKSPLIFTEHIPGQDEYQLCTNMRLHSLFREYAKELPENYPKDPAVLKILFTTRSYFYYRPVIYYRGAPCADITFLGITDLGGVVKTLRRSNALLLLSS